MEAGTEPDLGGMMLSDAFFYAPPRSPVQGGTAHGGWVPTEQPLIEKMPTDSATGQEGAVENEVEHLFMKAPQSARSPG
uniref:Bm8144 n=1 Tax=Brugia malayi TaxID=6279 RepID=A0A1I9G8E0_BRUMA|nr:Bm8144 [Brugia malayi]